MPQQGGTWVQTYEQIHVTIRAYVAPGNRTENSYVARAMIRCETHDLGSPLR